MASVESLQAALRVLVTERQALHQVGRPQELSPALIDRYALQDEVR